MELFVVFVIVVLAFFGQAWLFQWLWNWLVPALFHGPSLTYWQSMGLTALLALVASFFRSSPTKRD